MDKQSKEPSVVTAERAAEGDGVAGLLPDRIYVNARCAEIPMAGVYTLIAHEGDIEYSRANAALIAERDALRTALGSIRQVWHCRKDNNSKHHAATCAGCIADAALASTQDTATASAQLNNGTVESSVRHLPSSSAQAAAREIVPDCLSRTCFIRDCSYGHCWGCEDSVKERARVAAIITKHISLPESDLEFLREIHDHLDGI